MLAREAASSVVTHTEEYAQAIQEKKSLTKTLLDTGVSLKKDIDAFVAENKWAEYAKSGLEWLLRGVGYGVTVCAVSTVGAKFGTVAAIATAGGLVISGEATAEIINRGGEQLVDYAVSFADTPEEAAGYADVVISGLETIVTVAGAVGGYKAGKAMVGKLANLKARVPAKVGEAFGGKANLQITTTKAEIKAVAGKTTVMKAETAIASQAADSVCQKNVQRNVLDKKASDAINKAPRRIDIIHEPEMIRMANELPGEWKGAFKLIQKNDHIPLGEGLSPKLYSKQVLFNDSKSGQMFRVTQRNDIDPNYVVTKGTTKDIGKTNRELMLAGKAPYTTSGQKVIVHHMGQDARGPFIEVTAQTHKPQFHNQFGANKPHPTNPVVRTEFDSIRKAYWRAYAEFYK